MTPIFTQFELSITLLLKILGGRMHGPSSPPQILGDRPPSPPLSLRPCAHQDLTDPVVHSVRLRTYTSSA